jgi:hypothetical protein
MKQSQEELPLPPRNRTEKASQPNIFIALLPQGRLPGPSGSTGEACHQSWGWAIAAWL